MGTEVVRKGDFREKRHCADTKEFSPEERLTVRYDRVKQFACPPRMLLRAQGADSESVPCIAKRAPVSESAHCHIERVAIEDPVPDAVLFGRMPDTRLCEFEDEDPCQFCHGLAHEGAALSANALLPRICLPSMSLPNVHAPNADAVSSMLPVPANGS